METTPRNAEQDPRPKPVGGFRQVVWLQIYIPLILMILVLASLVTVLWVGSVGTFSGWADTALIFLIIPALLVGFIFLVVLAGLCYGIIYLIGWIPGPSKQVREIAERVAHETRRFADILVRPFFAPRAALSALGKAIRHLASIFSTD